MFFKRETWWRIIQALAWSVIVGVILMGGRRHFPEADAQEVQSTGSGVAANPPAAKANCTQPGGDCVEYLKRGGRPSLCTWASNMAVIGAYARDVQASWEGVDEAARLRLGTRMSRPLTDNERKEIARWMWFGWNSDATPYDVQGAAYNTCMEGK